MQRILVFLILILGMMPLLVTGQLFRKKRNNIDFVGRSQARTDMKYNGSMWGAENPIYVDVCNFSDGKDYVVMGWMKNAHAVYSTGFRCGHSNYVFYNSCEGETAAESMLRDRRKDKNGKLLD